MAPVSHPLVLATGAAALLLPVVYTLRSALRRQPTPEQLESERRAAVNQDGRVIAGMVIDILEDGGIVYEYDVAGVYYSTTQDVRLLDSQLPEERWRLIGPVKVKYAARNPSNSIILCENWSGFERIS